MSIHIENYVSKFFSQAAAYPCYTFGPPKPTPGDIYVPFQGLGCKNHKNGEKIITYYGFIPAI